MGKRIGNRLVHENRLLVKKGSKARPDEAALSRGQRKRRAKADARKNKKDFLLSSALDRIRDAKTGKRVTKVTALELTQFQK